MNKLALNTNKNEFIFFSRNNSDFGSVFTKTKFSQHKKCCSYLGIQIDRNLNFDEQLNKTLKKDGSCYKTNIPNKTSNSSECAHSSFKITCAFTLIVFGYLFSKFIFSKPKTL